MEEAFFKYSKTFYIPNDKFEHTNVEPHKIVMKPNTFPVSIKQLLIIPKKEEGGKQFRLVVDYKALNKVIEHTAYPIPLINEILDQMKNYVFIHNSRSRFEYSKKYTAFSTS